VILGQIPSLVEVAGVALVVVGVALHRDPEARSPAAHEAASPAAAY
jgi:hypothetical protein